MNPLKAGDIAPKFSLPDQDGEQVNLTDFQGTACSGLFLPESHDPPAVPYRPAAYAITWMS